MPPRSSLASQTSVTDFSNEVFCPLQNQNGSICHKRCFGEKRFRSIQEHIRRAHPQHYIPKLPATEESFNLMINTSPTIKTETLDLSTSTTNTTQTDLSLSGHGPSTFSPASSTSPTVPRLHRKASMLPAAAALTQLHESRPDNWQSAQFEEQEPFPAMNDNDLPSYYVGHSSPSSFNALVSEMTPQLRDGVSDSPMRGSSRRRSSLQAVFGKSRGHRPRKSSVTENARRPKHERNRSYDLKRRSLGHDKHLSVEPSPLHNRWEDLLDAAASATEADSRDLTPIPQSPARSSITPFPVPQLSSLRSPLHTSMLASPRNAGLSPYVTPHLEPFPSVEEPTLDPRSQDLVNSNNQHHSYHHLHHSSHESVTSNPFATFPRVNHRPQSSGSSFHIPSNFSSSPHNNLTAGNNTSHPAQANPTYPAQYSPIQQRQRYSPTTSQGHQAASPAGPASAPRSPPLVQHYCAACHRVTALSSSYACTECICGICRDCVDVLIGMGPERGARCPRCKTIGGRFKPFMLNLR